MPHETLNQDAIEHADLEERQIVELYLMGRLSPPEAARFEEHYLGCQACLDRLEAEERLQRAFRGVAAEEASRSIAAGILAWLTRLGRSGGAVVAAALALAAVSTVLWMRVDAERERLEDRLGGLAQPHGAAILRLGPERSAAAGEPSIRITLTPEIGSVVLLPELAELEGYATYRATLVGPGGEALWRSGSLARDPFAPSSISVPASLLEPGDHLLRVEAAPEEAGATLRFAFRVVR